MKNNNTTTELFCEFKNQKELLENATKAYINKFEENDIFSFKLSPEQVRKYTTDFFGFSSDLVNIQEKMSNTIFKISELLLAAYNKNDMPEIKIFDSYIRCFSNIQLYTNEFMENCSKHLKNPNTIRTELHKSAISLGKKIEALTSSYPELDI